jgi:site-specific DNA recombinase
LCKHGVALVSITQDVVEGDPAQVMMHKVIALFDEYQSKENAKHVLRAMKENARQGYWNCAKPPFGYTAVEVERRGSRVKKRLAIEPVEAETVRLHFGCFRKAIRVLGRWVLRPLLCGSTIMAIARAEVRCGASGRSTRC